MFHMVFYHQVVFQWKNSASHTLPNLQSVPAAHLSVKDGCNKGSLLAWLTYLEQRICGDFGTLLTF